MPFAEREQASWWRTPQGSGSLMSCGPYEPASRHTWRLCNLSSPAIRSKKSTESLGASRLGWVCRPLRMPKGYGHARIQQSRFCLSFPKRKRGGPRDGNKATRCYGCAKSRLACRVYVDCALTELLRPSGRFCALSRSHHRPRLQ